MVCVGEAANGKTANGRAANGNVANGKTANRNHAIKGLSGIDYKSLQANTGPYR
jgi:hypothetical protein